MKNSILENGNFLFERLSSAILDCYGHEQVSQNTSIIVDDEEITAWYICDLPKDELLSKNLSHEELIELYYLAI